MDDKFQKLADKRSDIHSKIKQAIEERLEIVQRGKSNFSIADHKNKLYSDMVCLFDTDHALKNKQRHLSILQK